MDPIADFQKMGLPLLGFVVHNEAIIVIVIVVVSIGWTSLTADGGRRPRELYQALFGTGTSKRRGDVPDED